MKLCSETRTKIHRVITNYFLQPNKILCFVGVFNEQLSSNLPDHEEDEAYYADIKKSSINISMLDAVIIKHEGEKEFVTYLTWLMRELGFSEVQIAKANKISVMGA